MAALNLTGTRGDVIESDLGPNMEKYSSKICTTMLKL